MPVAVLPGIRTGTNSYYGRDGHCYHFNRQMNGGRVSLRCSQYRLKHCHGRASCNKDGRDFKQTQAHNHPTEPESREVRLLRAAAKARSRADGQTDLLTIYHQERRRLRISPAAATFCPFPRLRNSMQKARYEALPNIPHTLTELRNILRDDRYKHLTKTLGRDGSIYAGTYGRSRDGTRCILFASRRQLRYLRRCKRLFCDATFDSVPAGLDACQIWNITTKRRGRIIPLARVLMQTKRTACYLVAIDAILTLVPACNPRSINCDFEPAQKKALRRRFPRCKIRGCLFHYAKNVIKNARQLGLHQEMVADEEVSRIVRMVCALPLLPMGLIARGLIVVGRRAVRKGRYALLANFLNYIDTTWLRPSVLPVLSVHRSEDRTSNICESDNARLAKICGAPHPNVFRFLGGLVEMEEVAMIDLATLQAGRSPTSRLRKASALINDEVIRNFQTDLENEDISISAFLRGVSRRLQGAINNFMA